MNDQKRVVVFGGTGAVGKEVTRYLLEGGFDVQMVVRRDVEEGEADVYVVSDVADLRMISESGDVPDVAVICLGTTLKDSGSKKRFEEVDRDLIIRVAMSLKLLGVEELHLLSSLGADEEARSFYLRVKGEMEAGVKEVGFERLVIYRPSLLAGAKRERERVGERVGEPVLSFLSSVLPFMRKFRPVDVRSLAQFMVSKVGKTRVNVSEYETLEILAGRGE